MLIGACRPAVFVPAFPGIQTGHPDYGKVDATSDTNEVMFEAFAAMFDGGECGNFDIVWGRFARISQLYATPHAQCGVYCLVIMGTGCLLVLAIRCCVQFGASGASRASAGT